MNASRTEKLPITAIVLTFNELLHIERCLSRIMPLVERVVVVDSFSTDGTVEIAQKMGADVVSHAFSNQAEQFQWALDTITVATSWIMKLDADEYLEDSAQAELRQRLPDLPDDVSALEFHRKVIFAGKWIRYGRYYQTVLLRLWRTGVGHVEQRWMDEHIVLSHGYVERIRSGDLVDHNLNDLTWWIEKHNRYATRHMVDFINREYGLFEEDRRLEDTASTASRRRFLKTTLYGRTPVYLRAALFFLYRYVIRLGFLDGKIGFLFHSLHGFWLMLLIDGKIEEARTFIRKHGIDAFRDHLEQRFGIRVGPSP